MMPLWQCQGNFFFSRRRRHTRFDCDWSSDVCSSDLSAMYMYMALPVAQEFAGLGTAVTGIEASRSEERRVGKECRSVLREDHDTQTECLPPNTSRPYRRLISTGDESLSG